MGTYVLPDARTVSDLLTGLLGRDVKAKKAAAVDLGSLQSSTVAAYASSEGEVGALCVCDVSLAGNAGAALSLIPSGVAQESVSTGQLAENLMENFAEVMNVATNLFSSGDSPRLSLRAVQTSQDELPKDVKALLSEPGTRVDLDVGIPGYGEGKMTLVARARP